MPIRFRNPNSARICNLTRRLVPLAFSIVVLLPVSVVSQIRLHDPAKDDLAKKTREAYTDFTKEDNTVFDKMISNTLELKKATLSQLIELNAQVRRDKINVIPITTWKDLREKHVKTAQNQFLIAYQASKKILAPGAAPPKDIAAALADAKAQLKAKNDAMAAKKKALEGPQTDLKSLKDSLDALKDAAVLSAQPVKNLSDLKTQFSNVKAVWSNVNEVRDWLEAAEEAQAPGLQLSILDLGVQHQQFIVERLQLQLEEAKAAQAKAAQIDRRLEDVWGDGSVDAKGRPILGLFGQVYRYLDSASASGLRHPFDIDDNEQVIQTIGRLAAIAEKETDGRKPEATLKLRNLMDVLSRYVSLIGYHQYLLLADMIEAGVDKNLFSIRLSAINMREREMLVSHGLEGLAAYHAGGLKPEDIANFFRAVESIGVSVLSGRK